MLFSLYVSGIEFFGLHVSLWVILGGFDCRLVSGPCAACYDAYPMCIGVETLDVVFALHFALDALFYMIQGFFFLVMITICILYIMIY